MGFFDPAYKKTLVRTPASFQALAATLLPQFEERLRLHRTPNPDIWKAATLGLIAMHVSDQDRGFVEWSPGARAYVIDHTKIALRCMRDDERADACAAADEVVAEIVAQAGLQTT